MFFIGGRWSLQWNIKRNLSFRLLRFLRGSRWRGFCGFPFFAFIRQNFSCGWRWLAWTIFGSATYTYLLEPILDCQWEMPYAIGCRFVRRVYALSNHHYTVPRNPSLYTWSLPKLHAVMRRQHRRSLGVSGICLVPIDWMRSWDVFWWFQFHET